MTIKELIESYEKDLTNAKTTFVNRSKRMHENPEAAVHYMEWSGMLFDAGAQIKVLDEVLNLMVYHQDLAVDVDAFKLQVMDSLEKELRDLAAQASNKSTSVTTNYLRDCILSQRATIMKELIFNMRTLEEEK